MSVLSETENALVSLSATSTQIEALIEEGLALDDGAGGWLLSVAGQKQRALLLAELDHERTDD